MGANQSIIRALRFSFRARWIKVGDLFRGQARTERAGRAQTCEANARERKRKIETGQAGVIHFGRLFLIITSVI